MRMAEIVVVGAGLNGLLAAMMLAKDGHHVVVLEKDPAPPPHTADTAWSDWERRGINQFRLPHFLASRWRQVVEAEAPEVVPLLENAGALRANPIADAPESLTGGHQQGDERFDVLTGRRPVVEACVARSAESTAGVTMRRGVEVTALQVATTQPVPRICGVVLDSGEQLGADLVVDASGRRSGLPRLLTEAGAAPPREEVEDSGFVYYGRHFRSRDGSLPFSFGPPLQHYQSVTTLTLPADNLTWSVTLVGRARDTELRALSDPETWERVARSYPLIAHWLDGDPVEDRMAVISGIEDRIRHFSDDSGPLATGVVAVGDSWSCTNPSLGRGASIGALHVQTLRDEIRNHGLDDVATLTEAFCDATTRVVEPWYRTTLAFDRHRLAEMAAQIDGERYQPDDPTWNLTKALEKATGSDGDALRAFADIGTVQHLPDVVFSRPGLLDTVLEKGAGWEDDAPPGPSRDELLALIHGE